jgi:glycosyltransferase involved in cell wall biosynthesis
MAEGVQLTRVVPASLDIDSLDLGEQRVALATRLSAPMRVLPWMRQARANRLAESLEKSLPDVIYAIGMKAWSVGMDLAVAIDRPIILDVCSVAQANAVPRPSADAAIAGYITPCQPLAKILHGKMEPSLVHVAPIGIGVPPQPCNVFENREQSVAIAVIGEASDVHAYSAMLSGVRLASMDLPLLQIMLELHGPNEHDVWKKVHSLELLEHVSAISDASIYRALLAQCDLMLVPEAYGEPRSLMLEAMALGIPVIAAHDPVNDGLIEGITARLVQNKDVREWTDRIRDIVHSPLQARELGMRAREYVLAHNRSSAQVTQLLKAFEQAVTAAPFPLNMPR